MSFVRDAAKLALGLLLGAMVSSAPCAAQQASPQVAAAAGYVNPPVPLLSIGSLSFLEGTWAANSLDGKHKLGTYTWATELQGHVLARHGSSSPGCGSAGSPVCGHNDLLYVYQDSAGAPLQALYFDDEGHVIRYEISMRHDELPAGRARRDFAVFLSEAAALGPRYRLSYERNTDTETGATILSGRFEVLLANNQWRTYMEWSGKKL